MRAVVMRELGAPSVLKIEDIPIPAVQPEEVLVKVGAVGVTYHDVVQRNGTMRRHTELPIILGYEIAGTVERLGERVSHLKVGDRICTKAFHSCGRCRLCRNGMETACERRQPVHGGYAEYAALPEEVCAVIPADMPFEIACMLGPSTGVALNAVRDTGKVRIGETVLVTGASGGVGLPTIEIARSAGATVIALSRSHEKSNSLLEAGAHHVVVAAGGADFSKEVQALTDGKGVDVVIDNVGSRVFTPSFKCLALGGRYVMVGQLVREEISINPAFVFFKRAQILGVGSVRRDQLEDAVKLVASGRVRPKVAGVMPLEDVVKAHEKVEAGMLVGRVVLRP
ncbi:Zinc-binding dehydrogenase [Hyphomicrobiales bacterium]|nr:Zinc-binding dehydrogenase [Hyphomicrobiales bacterium]CAH1696524.1 Zinc-binding dehydrogenase [Hyphomicrobiales bacterium]